MELILRLFDNINLGTRTTYSAADPSLPYASPDEKTLLSGTPVLQPPAESDDARISKLRH
jgi:hypothetical protein